MKKILVVSDVPIFELTSGNRKCIKEYCDLLKKKNNEVYYLLITNHNSNKNDIQKTGGYFKKNFILYKSNILEELIHALKMKYRRIICKNNFRIDDFCHFGIRHYIKKVTTSNDFDVVIVNYVYYSKLLDCCKVKEKVLFTHDTYSMQSIRIGKHSGFSVSPNDESKGLQRADIILAIQENEKTFFQYLAPQRKVLCVYSPFNFVKQSITLNSNILFFSGDNILNINGINWFIQEIFPLIQSAFPSAQLLIGGSICNKLEETCKQLSNISFCGKYDNPEKFYAQGDIVVNPTFQGNGLKIKTIEALAYGKTTIVHTHSSEGIFNKNTAPFFAADNAVEFSKLVLYALENPGTRISNQEKAAVYISEYNAYIESQYSNI